MTLRQLEIFLGLAEAGSIAPVARNLGLTQSAVSMAVKNLEDDLEEHLFERMNRRLVLNESGRVFLRRVRPLVLGLLECENLFRGEEVVGELRIAVSTTIAIYVLPEIIYDFSRLHEQVNISMEVGNTRDVLAMVETGRADLGFVEGEVEHEDIVKQVLAEDELFVVSGDTTRWTAPSYPLDALLTEPWIMREQGSGTRDIFLSHLGPRAAELNVFMELGHSEAIKAMLIRSGHLSCLSQYVVRKELARGELRRIKVDGLRFTRRFYTLLHPNKHESAVIKAFTTFAAQSIAGGE